MKHDRDDWLNRYTRRAAPLSPSQGRPIRGAVRNRIERLDLDMEMVALLFLYPIIGAQQDYTLFVYQLNEHPWRTLLAQASDPRSAAPFPQRALIEFKFNPRILGHITADIPSRCIKHYNYISYSLWPAQITPTRCKSAILRWQKMERALGIPLTERLDLSRTQSPNLPYCQRRVIRMPSIHPLRKREQFDRLDLDVESLLGIIPDTIDADGLCLIDIERKSELNGGFSVVVTLSNEIGNTKRLPIAPEVSDIIFEHVLSQRIDDLDPIRYVADNRNIPMRQRVVYMQRYAEIEERARIPLSERLVPYKSLA